MKVNINKKNTVFVVATTFSHISVISISSLQKKKSSFKTIHISKRIEAVKNLPDDCIVALLRVYLGLIRKASMYLKQFFAIHPLGTRNHFLHVTKILSPTLDLITLPTLFAVDRFWKLVTQS